MTDRSESLEAFMRKHVQRFADLIPLKVGPPDRFVERYKRERYSVVGRPDERPEGDAGVATDTQFNIGYIRCEPGKGHCLHSHPDVEVFIPLTGLWEINVKDVGSFTAGPFDVVAMPPDSIHSATNISDEVGYMLSANDGMKTAPYTIPSEVLQEIAEAKRASRSGKDTVGEAAS